MQCRGSRSTQYAFYVDSAAEGEKSLKDREKREMEVVRAIQESSHSLLALRQAPVNCNSSQEANAMVLAKWAADENNIVDSTERNDARKLSDEDHNVVASNTTGILVA